jgi:hypothetical protein
MVPPPPAEAFASPELSPDEKAAALRALDERHVKGCVRCPLSTTRRNTVFGEGSADADLMFVGEGPGGTEDATGRPFVGKSGQKLDEMIRAMGLSRDTVYIANVVKCRAFLPGPPPRDRPPQADEVAACMPYLQRHIEVGSAESDRDARAVGHPVPARRQTVDEPDARAVARVAGRPGDADVPPVLHPAELHARDTTGGVGRPEAGDGPAGDPAAGAGPITTGAGPRHRVRIGRGVPTRAGRISHSVTVR